MPELSLRQHLSGRLAGLRTDRYSFWAHWQELASYILPRRYRWLITPNQYNRGSPINGTILDSTGTIAARVLANGMFSGICSPTRPWFKLKIQGFDMESTNPVTIWLAECERRLFRIFAESNFYNAMAVLFHDLVVFNSACALVYEDFDDVIRLYNPALGEFYFGNSDRMKVDTVYREFTLTVGQTVQQFGIENCSPEVQTAFRNGGASLQSEIKIGHAIEPISTWGPKDGDFLFREVYWEIGSADDLTLKQSGFYEFPGLCPRWELTGNDAYGRGPGMEALPDIKQLQQETKRKAQAIDKMVNPPMVADVTLKNQPASLLPGGVTYVAGLSSGNNAGFRPAYQVAPQINELTMDITEIQTRIKSIFFNDLFLMISQLETVRSATEIDSRREEKIIQLGPVLERFENEALDPVIDRSFAIAMRAGLLPPPPPEIQGAFIQVEYVSMLASAQKAAKTTGIERTFAMAGNLAAVKPDVLDNIDFDKGITKYSNLLDVDPDLIRDPKIVQKMRADRAKQEAAMQDAAMAQAAAQTGKVLSETDVGGGLNAIQALTGGTIQ